MQFDFDQVLDRRGTNSIKWGRYDKDVLPLWIADMDFVAPEPTRDVLRKTIEHGIFGYEMPTRKLSQIVAARMQRLYGWEVSPEMVLATPGVVAGFNLAARAVCHPGEGILVQPPVYPPFLALPQQTGTVRQMAPLRRVHNGHLLRYEIDWPTFETAVNSQGARTAMFLLCQPHNPTGHIFSRADLERIAQIALKNQSVLCSDEIHSELLLNGARHVPPATLSPEIAQHTITLISASKTFNLMGLFCSFAIIPNESIRRRYLHEIEQSAMHVNSFGLLTAEVAMSGACDKWLAALLRYLTANRDYVVDFVKRELPGVRVAVPDATCLLWLDFGDWVREGKISNDPYAFLLEKAKVGLNPGNDFGPGSEFCVRLNFACPRSTLAEAMRRIKETC